MKPDQAHSLPLFDAPASPRSDARPRMGKPGPPLAPAFAVLHVADFPLHALLRLSPDLVDRPVALLESERKRATVLAATASARAEGVTPGLTAPQAQARCAALLIRPRQPAVEAEAQAALLAAAGTLSALIEATSPGVVTADVSARPAAQREPALRAALTQLTHLGLPATGGLAATPLLALYAARTLSLSSSSLSSAPAPKPPPRSRDGGQGEWPHEAQKAQKLRGAVAEPLEPFAAKKNPRLGAEGRENGQEKRKENEGRRYIIVTNTRAFLAPLPLAVAEPPAELAPILAAWGLQTLGDLTALPKADIVQRLGPAGLALWERAAGETTRPLDPVTPALTFAAALELEEPVETLEPLLFLLRRFLDRLTLDLRAAGLVAAELQLTLNLEDETEHARSFRLPEPTAEADILFRTLHSHLETLTTASAIAAVRLTLEPARPLARQHGLFDTSLRDPHGFAETLARTVAVVGSGRVGTPRREDTHRPDALSLAPPASVVPPAAPPEVLAPIGLPLRRFRPPLPAKVELTATSALAYVFTHRLHGAVTAVRGPWRGSGDWWQPELRWEREEWDVELAGGGLYRVVRTPDGWWLEGEYD